MLQRKGNKDTEISCKDQGLPPMLGDVSRYRLKKKMPQKLRKIIRERWLAVRRSRSSKLSPKMLLGSPVAPVHGGAAASASEPTVTSAGFGIGNQLSASNATKDTPEKSKNRREKVQDYSMMTSRCQVMILVMKSYCLWEGHSTKSSQQTKLCAYATKGVLDPPNKDWRACHPCALHRGVLRKSASAQGSPGASAANPIDDSPVCYVGVAVSCRGVLNRCTSSSNDHNGVEG